MLTALSVGIIFLLSSLMQGLTGFGSALVAMPLLCLFIDIKVAIPLCMLTSIIISSTLATQLKSSISPAKVIPLCLGSIPGIIVGVTLLKTVDDLVIRFFLGALLVLYALFNLFVRPKPRKLPQAYSWLAGFLSGAIGAAFSAGGPPTIVYTTMNDWTKDEIKATLTSFFLFCSILTSSIHAISGVTTGYTVQLFLIAAPFVLAGTVSGSLLYRFIPAENYKQIIFVVLLIMGLLLMKTS